MRTDCRKCKKAGCSSIVCIAKIWEETDTIPKIAIEEQGYHSGWTREQISAWRNGSWTKDKVDDLLSNLDIHIDNCKECQNNLKTPPNDNDPYYCEVGEKLSEDWCQAETEYSWQPDFNGLKLGKN